LTRDIQAILIDKQTISQRVLSLGQEIDIYYSKQGIKNIVAICVMNGAIVFFCDLVRSLKVDAEMEFVRVSSYGNSSKSSGQITISKDIETSIKDKHVLIVDDIVDSGNTLSQLSAIMQARQPASIKVCTFLNKPSRRQIDFNPDFNGFIVPDEFIVGYGLDYAGHYRQLPYLGILNPSVYNK